jgi:hypothetical protein
MKTWNTILKATFGLLILLCVAASAGAQGRVNLYVVTTPTLTFNDISGTGNYFYGGRLHWSDYTTTTLPFDFKYDNQTISAGSTISVTAGSLRFNSAGPIYFESNGGLGNSAYNSLLAFWGSDEVCAGDYNNGNYTYIYDEVDGSYPNRVYTIQLGLVHGPYGTGWSTDYMCNMQVKLYESTGVIQYLYQDHSKYINGSYSAGIGLNGGTSPSFASKTWQSGLYTTPQTDVQFTPPPPPAQLSLQPKSLNFGFTTPVLPVTMCATAKSVSTADITVRGFNISGSTDFAISSGPPVGTVIPAGQSVQYCFTFTPTASGGRSATFTLVTNGNDSGTQSVVLSGNGVLPNAQYGATDLFRKVRIRLGSNSAPQYVTVQSTGLAPLTFGSIYMTGLDADNYTISHMPLNPLPPGRIDSIGVIFSPKIEGRPDAALVINSDAQSVPHDTVKMLGIGILPRLVLTAPAPGNTNNMRFDSVALGDSVCQAVQLANPGSDTLHLRRQIMTSADYDFSFYPLTGSDTLILPGATKLINVCFRPLKNGSRLATIRFYTDIPKTFDVPSQDTSQFVLNISGIGVPYGVLSLLGPLVDTAEVEKTECVNDTIVNNGQSELTVTSATLSGTQSAAFNWNAVLPITLAPSEKRVVQICFAPTTPGNVSATLTFNTTSAGRTSTSTVPVAGFGVQYCATSNPVSAVPFSASTASKTLLGTTATSDVVVTNCGNVPATYTVGALTAPYSVTPATSGMVAPGSTATFTVNFAPTTMGAAAGTLTITGGPTPMALTLGGIGGDAVLSANNPNPTVDTGDTKNIDVIVTNNGNMDWNAYTSGQPMLSGQFANDFAYVSGPGTINASSNGTLTLSFHPSTVGPESVTVTFPNESPVPSTGATSVTVNGVGALPTGGIAVVTQANGFVLGQSYPNPMHDGASVQVTIPYAAPVQVDIVDAHGAVVKTAYAGELSRGDNTIALDASNLASGTYFYVLTSGETRLARQFTILH